MIETRFEVGVEKQELHDLSYAQGCGVVAIGVLVAAPLGAWIGYVIGGPLGILGLMLGLLSPAIWIFGRAHFSPKQSIETLLKSDGVTVWGYNRRLPSPAQTHELFALPLDQITVCESGRAMEVFGTDFQLGAYKAVPYSMVGNQNTLAQRERIASQTSAIFLKGQYGLTPIFAENIATSLLYELVGKVNRFLDDARALNHAAPCPASVSSSAPRADGFDL